MKTTATVQKKSGITFRKGTWLSQVKIQGARLLWNNVIVCTGATVHFSGDMQRLGWPSWSQLTMWLSWCNEMWFHAPRGYMMAQEVGWQSGKNVCMKRWVFHKGSKQNILISGSRGSLQWPVLMYMCYCNNSLKSVEGGKHSWKAPRFPEVH
jgi:hypothetical protein